MFIGLREMPAERVHRVELDGVAVPGYVNEGDGGWYWKDGNVEEVGFLTKETAALALVTRHIDAEFTRLKAKKDGEVVKASVDGVKFWECDNCHRTTSRPFSQPPTMCSCGLPQWRELHLEEGATE